MLRGLLVLLAIASLVPCSHSQDKAASTKVEGTFIIPKEVASFDDRLVEIRLYKFDPRLADKSADLVEKAELKNFAHAAGKETKKDFVIGTKGMLEPNRDYYVTFFILDKGMRTHIGKCDHDKEGIGKVLTNGQPNKIKIEVREIKR
jgi:hypothetical protein